MFFFLAKIMGNLFNPCIRFSRFKNRKVLQIVKMDGKLIEFTAPILVKDLLIKFQGFGVKSSKKATNHLPQSFELKLGKVYYLFPSKSHLNHQAAEKSKVTISPEVEAVGANTHAVKRIKVVITKKQLQDLLSKKISAEKILLGIDKSGSVDSSTNWKPSLVSIPEENELNTM